MRVEMLRRRIAKLFRLQVILWVLFAYELMMHMIPDELSIENGDLDAVSLQVPVRLECEDTGSRVIDTAAVVSNDSTENDARIVQNQVDLTAKLFGLIPVKNVSANVVDQQSLQVSGENIGLYVQTNGVMVIGTGEFTDAGHNRYSPAQNVLKAGDYICAVDGVSVTDKEALVARIEQSDGKAVTLSVRRNGELLELYIQPRPDEQGKYKIGVWVRDDLAGIGTLTFIDSSGRFGALGHCISDMDTGIQMEIAEGRLYCSTIVDIVKGKDGEPGQLSGVINYDEKYQLGVIDDNSGQGVYGLMYSDSPLLEECMVYPVGYKQDILLSDAEILCNLEGTIKPYHIVIQEIRYQEDRANKSILFEVDDERLLNMTGGIVQGMSGSPIIQNGKIIGAVTHVFIQDSSKGYGIFIENMLKEERKG
ncbi:MAG: SpoIVB peptidase [Lachnospiraceae bacterium]|nr:SpoIVB peptidase [Lachnospiraceae bacterium]